MYAYTDTARGKGGTQGIPKPDTCCVRRNSKLTCISTSAGSEVPFPLVPILRIWNFDFSNHIYYWIGNSDYLSNISDLFRANNFLKLSIVVNRGGKISGIRGKDKSLRINRTPVTGLSGGSVQGKVATWPTTPVWVQCSPSFLRFLRLLHVWEADLVLCQRPMSPEKFLQASYVNKRINLRRLISNYRIVCTFSEGAQICLLLSL